MGRSGRLPERPLMRLGNEHETRMKIQIYSIRTEKNRIKQTLLAVTVAQRNDLMRRIMGLHIPIPDCNVLDAWNDFAELRSSLGEYHSWDSHEIEVPIQLVVVMRHGIPTLYSSHPGLHVQRFDFDVFNDQPEALEAQCAAAVTGMAMEVIK